jgi:hypothetical protein
MGRYGVRGAKTLTHFINNIGHTVQFEFALITRCCLVFLDRAVHLIRRFIIIFSFFFLEKKILLKKLNKFVSHIMYPIDI